MQNQKDKSCEIDHYATFYYSLFSGLSNETNLRNAFIR